MGHLEWGKSNGANIGAIQMGQFKWGNSKWGYNGAIMGQMLLVYSDRAKGTS